MFIEDIFSFFAKTSYYRMPEKSFTKKRNLMIGSLFDFNSHHSKCFTLIFALTD